MNDFRVLTGGERAAAGIMLRALRDAVKSGDQVEILIDPWFGSAGVSINVAPNVLAKRYAISFSGVAGSGGTTTRDPRKDRTMVAKAKKTAKKTSKRTTKSPKAAAGKTAKKPAKKAARKTAKK